MAYRYRRDLVLEEWMYLKEFVKENYVDTEHLSIHAHRIKKVGWFFPEVFIESAEEPYDFERWKEYYRENCSTDEKYFEELSNWEYRYYQNWFVIKASVIEAEDYGNEDDFIAVDVIDDYELYQKHKDEPYGIRLR